MKSTKNSARRKFLVSQYLFVSNNVLLPEMRGSDLNSELLFTQVSHSLATEFMLIVVD